MIIYSYLKVVIRNLIRFKTFSLINTFGLAVGFTSTFLILFHVIDDLSYDRFHKNSDEIYQLIRHNIKNDRFFSDLTYSEGTAIVDKYSEIKNSTVFTERFSPLVKFGDHFIRGNSCIYADSNFLKIFSFNLIHKSTNDLLVDPYTVLMSEQTVKKYFGNEDALNREITVNNFETTYNLKVVGIFEKLPANSTFNADIIIPITFKNIISEDNFEDNSPNFRAFVHVPNKTSIPDLEKLITEQRKSIYPKENMSYKLLPFTDLHLRAEYVEGNFQRSKGMDDIYIYSSIAFLILFIACINFIILNTARISQKGKEVGVRKLVGASNKVIQVQLIGETAVNTIIALPLSLILFDLLLPVFNDLIGKEMEFSFSLNIIFLSIAAIISISVSLLSGLLIAFRYNQLNIVNVLKNQIFIVKNKIILRRIFIIIQLSISVLLIICTFIMVDQINFLSNKDLGFEKEQLVIFTYPVFNKSKIEIFKRELKNNPNIINVASGSHMPPSNMISKGRITNPEIMNEPKSYEHVSVDDKYFSTIGAKIIDGRNFKDEISTDSSYAIVVNEEFIKSFNLKENLEDPIPWFNNNRIIGIVKDYHIRGLYEKVPPAAFFLNSDGCWQIIVKIKNENIPQTISFIKNKWEEFNTKEIFSYNFADEKFNNLYKQDLNFAKIVGFSSMLAIIITCMGIFGLTLITIEQRTKEIGIRKILGASVQRILNLLYREYAVYILISIILASPFALSFMDKWLNNYAYRISISSIYFILSIITVLLVVLTSVSLQTIKAALQNPVESLRNE